MSQNLEKRLLLAFERLENAAEKIKATKPFGKEEAKYRMLSEMIKEQFNHENSHTTTRTPR